MVSKDIFSGLQTFVQAADAGSFTLAAQRLGLTKSAVSKSVTRLEERLRIRLFHRTTRSLNLTGEGQTLYESCARALAELEAAEATLAANRHTPSGRLRIDLPYVFGRKCIMPVLLKISDQYPDLSLDISFTNRRVDLVEEGIDLVVRIGELDDSTGLVARRLGTQKLVVCGSPDYVNAHGRPRSPGDLSSHNCISYFNGGRSHPWLFKGAGGIMRPQVIKSRLRFGSGDVITTALLNGHGLAQRPTWLISEHLKSGNLESVMDSICGEGAPIHALWSQTHLLAPKIRVVVDELIAAFFPTPPWEC